MPTGLIWSAFSVLGDPGRMQAQVKIKQGMGRLLERSQYLAVAKSGRKWITPSFIMQAQAAENSATGKSTAEDEETHGGLSAVIPLTGFTVSKKVGNAVQRNRARRRLKEAAARVMPDRGVPGWRYVIIGRHAAIDYSFDRMQKDMMWALAKLHAGADLRKANGRQKHG